ncbi:hypothetical protein AQUSIP_21020 [Aquicella siphonis]|uniref:Uncharacterized protein n=1 Tax=Aquicella siphonis TaxID=254247 RepID=A0A5E4PKN5_9COXI|nr:hypothetical protein [Aquicella siphonis]VVC75974.1 hypothetical protein AQUSIP_12750 [Aquicella siphonis]VVC76776.1 hypothetical protein AQUSIP_21020 [Aquicella siphonis]
MVMNKAISSTQEPSTYSGIALLSVSTVAGILIGGFVVSVPKNEMPVPFATKYYSAMKDSSYDSHSDILKTDFSLVSDIAFDELMGLFYQKMLTSQEKLESDFSKIYFKNAWNLYES